MNQEPRQNVRFIATRPGAVIREQADGEVLGRVEQLRQLAKAIRTQHDRANIRAKRRLVRAAMPMPMDLMAEVI